MGQNIPGGVKEIKQMFREQAGAAFGGHVGWAGGEEPKEMGQSWAEARLRREDCIL